MPGILNEKGRLFTAGPKNAERFKVIMRKADFLKPAFLNFVQFLGDLAFISDIGFQNVP